MRKAQITRKTNETNISISLDIDGSGNLEIDTGIGFFDHMLTHIGKHGIFDLNINAKGDTYVDCHHTVEDVGIVFGSALKKCIGDKKGINRYGDAIVPMDESLVLCAVDLSGRAFVDVDTPFTVPKIGDFDTEMVKEFFQAFGVNAMMNLHIQVLRGTNNHHIAEAMFKAFGRALMEAVSINPRISGVMSTKGSL